MSAPHLAALVLLVVGSALVIVAAVAVVVLPSVHDRLHSTAVATTLGAPLICLGLAVDSAGQPHSVFKYLFTAAILLVTGPVMTVATARAVMAHAQRNPTESPR